MQEDTKDCIWTIAKVAGVLLFIATCMYGCIRADQKDQEAMQKHCAEMQNWQSWQLEKAARYEYGAGGETAMDILAYRALNGEHEVRRMLPAKTVQEAHLSGSIGGSFILGFGGISGSQEGSSVSKTTITFAWKMPDGAYAITTLPLDMFRVKLVPNAEPKVYFQWQRKWETSRDFSAKGLSGLIQEVTVTCDPKDWPSEITLPTAQ